MLERYLTIEELLDLPSVEWDKPREAPCPVVSDPSEADRAARSLRVHWGLGLDPIPNLVELLEERGIKSLAVPLTNIDGLTASVRRTSKVVAPVVVVNSNAHRRGAPDGESSALIKTLLSTTSRSAFLGEQLLEALLRQALRSRVVSGFVHRPDQIFPRALLPSFVVFNRHNDNTGAVLPGYRHRLALGGFNKLTELVLRLDGGDGFHFNRRSSGNLELLWLK